MRKLDAATGTFTVGEKTPATGSAVERHQRDGETRHRRRADAEGFGSLHSGHRDKQGGGAPVFAGVSGDGPRCITRQTTRVASANRDASLPRIGHN